MTDFNTDLKTGKEGEQLFAAAMTARGHKVEDVSDIQEYRNKDIDFIISNKTGSTTVEVKNDVRSNTTGNVFVETYCQENRSRYGDGWYYYCEADYLAFVQDMKLKAHIVSRYDLVNLCEKNTYRVLHKWDGSSSGYIVPIGDLQKCQSYICIDLKGEIHYDF